MQARIEVLARTQGGWTVHVIKGRRTVWRREAGTMAELRRALNEAARRRRG